VADIHGIPSEADMVPVRPGEMSGPLEDLSALAASAMSVANGARQAEAQALLESPQGAGLDGQFVLAGDGTLGFPADVTPPDSVSNGGYGGA
jgi:hypothetical protein